MKILGMGVGNEPLYFCDRGEYLAHERAILEDFAALGFDFSPKPLSVDESIRYLVDDCHVSSSQATQRMNNNDILTIKFIAGIPFATQTGHFRDYDINITLFENGILNDMLLALQELRDTLNKANIENLIHNDPMPPNIISTLDYDDNIIVRLVDFELAQNWPWPTFRPRRGVGWGSFLTPTYSTTGNGGVAETMIKAHALQPAILEVE